MGNVISFASRASLFSREELTRLRTGNLKEDARLSRALMGKADTTANTYRAALKQFDQWLAGRQVSDECLADYVMHLHEEGRAPSSPWQKSGEVTLLTLKWRYVYGKETVSGTATADVGGDGETASKSGTSLLRAVEPGGW